MEVVEAAEMFMLIESCLACLKKQGKMFTHNSEGEKERIFLR